MTDRTPPKDEAPRRMPNCGRCGCFPCICRSGRTTREHKGCDFIAAPWEGPARGHDYAEAYQRGQEDGAREMRERAAKEADEFLLAAKAGQDRRKAFNSAAIGRSIRALPIKKGGE